MIYLISAMIIIAKILIFLEVILIGIFCLPIFLYYGLKAYRNKLIINKQIKE